MATNIQKRKIEPARKQAVSARLTLVDGKIRRLCPLPTGIRVISGWAWVSWKGQDMVLMENQEIRFAHDGDDPLISPVGRSALTIEIL